MVATLIQRVVHRKGKVVINDGSGRRANISWVIATAMIITIVVAAIAGSLLPSVLRRLQIDPAIAGGVVLTTITDVTGFFVFLGLATLVYA